MPEASEGIRLNEKLFEEGRRLAGERINLHGLHDLILQSYSEKERDTMSDFDRLEELGKAKYFPTAKEASVVEAVTNGMAVFYALRDQLHAQVLGMPSRGGRELDDREETFIGLFSLYAGCVETLTELEQVALPEDVAEFGSINKNYRTKIWGTKNSQVRLTDSKEMVVDNLSREYVRNLVFKLGIKAGEGFIHKKVSGNRQLSPDGNFSGMTMNFYLSLLDWLSAEGARDEYAPIRQACEFPLMLHKASINGFSYRPSGAAGEDAGLQLDIGFEDIIGNQEAKDLLQFSIEKLFLYDPQEQANPYMELGIIPRTVLLYAGPGTGKTMTLKAAIKYAYELAEVTGKHLEVVTIEQTFKDKYVGESAKRLKADLLRGMNPNTIGIITIEDIDALFMNRSSPDAGQNQAEQNALQELLNMLEGLKTKYFGNWIVLATSNRAHGVDKALKDRIAQFQVNCPGATTLDELILLSQNLTKKGLSNGYLEVTPEQWQEIAAIAKNNGYNGRQIRNAATSLLSDVGLFPIDRKVYEMDPHSQMEWFGERLRERRVTGDMLLDAVRMAAEHDEEQRKYDLDEKITSWKERQYTLMRGDERARAQIAEEDAKDINESLDAAGEEGRKLLTRLQTEEMQRMEKDIADLTQQKAELERQIADALGKKPEEGKRGDGKDKKK